MSKIILVSFALIGFSTFAGEAKGPQKQEVQLFKLALEHAADLNLSDDQKEKLIKLRDTASAEFEKLKNDPDLKALLAQVRSARKDGDQQKAKQLRKQLRDELEKKGGDPLLKALEDAKGTLSSDQLAKLKEFQVTPGKKKAATKEATPEKAPAVAERPADRTSSSEPKKETAAKPETTQPGVDEDREALLELLKEYHPDIYARIVDGKDAE